MTKLSNGPCCTVSWHTPTTIRRHGVSWPVTIIRLVVLSGLTLSMIVLALDESTIREGVSNSSGVRSNTSVYDNIPTSNASNATSSQQNTTSDGFNSTNEPVSNAIHLCILLIDMRHHMPLNSLVYNKCNEFLSQIEKPM